MKKLVVTVLAATLAVGFCSHAACPPGMEGLGLTIWLDATDLDGNPEVGNPADGTAIRSWKDKATGFEFTPIKSSQFLNNNVYVNDDNYRPHVYAKGRAGKDVVTFGRALDYRKAQYLGVKDSRIAALFDTSNTAFVVAQSTLGGSDDSTQMTTYLFARHGSHSGFGFDGYPLATKLHATRWLGGVASGANGNLMPTANYRNGTWIAASRIIHGDTKIAGAAVEVFVNNRMAAASTNATAKLWNHGTNNENPTMLCIGHSGREDQNYVGGFSGHIAEIMIFNRALTEAERQTVWNYLNARWRLSASEGEPYDDGMIKTDDDSVTRTDLGGGSFLYSFTSARGKVSVAPVGGVLLERALVVGGGGAGGVTLGGGGGGGEVRTVAGRALLNPFTLEVGDGGSSIRLANVQQAAAQTTTTPNLGWRAQGGAGGASALTFEDEETVALGGGGGASWSAGTAASTTGAAPLATGGGGAGAGGKGGAGNLHKGADMVDTTLTNGYGAGGGAGAYGDGLAAVNDENAWYAGQGGPGVESDITGDRLDYGAGGGGGGGNKIHAGKAGGSSAGDGGKASDFASGLLFGQDGLDGRGGGGGGGGYTPAYGGGRGGSGAVLLLVRRPTLAIADAFASNAVATARGRVVVTYIPEQKPGSTCLLSLEDDTSKLPEEGWAPCDGPIPAFVFPDGTPYGTVTVYCHVKSPEGAISTLSATIEYVDPAACAPVVTVKDGVIVPVDEASGEATPLTVDMIKDSVTSDYGVYSETIDVTGILTSSTNVTLTVTNKLGVAGSATATVTGSPLVCHVSPDGSDETGTGWSGAPFRTITNAVAQAAAGLAADAARHLRTVVMRAGDYKASEGQGFPVTLPDGVDLKGAGMGVTVLDAENARNHLVVSSGTSAHVLSDFSLRNAQARFFQAGAASVTVRNVEMSGCRAGNGAIYLSTGTTACNCLFENLVMTNVTVATDRLFFASGRGSFGLKHCRFADVTINVPGHGSGIYVCGQNGAVNDTSGWPASITDCEFSNWSCKGATINPNEQGIIMFSTASSSPLIDRCLFRNILTSDNKPVRWITASKGGSTQPIISNSLFDGVHASVFGAFRNNLRVCGCTFHGCSCVFAPVSDVQIGIYVQNCSVSSCTKFGDGNTSYIYLQKSNNIFKTSYENQYNVTNSEEPTTYDPNYRNAEAGNFKLKPLSQLVDLGNNANAKGDFDLAGTTRILAGKGGEAKVDVGCYEYDPSSSSGGFKFELPNYGLFEDCAVTLRAKIDPAPDAPVTANVVYPDGVTGPGTVTLSGEYETLTVTATNELQVADGTVVELTLQDPDGVYEEASAGLMLHRRTVVVPGYRGRIFLRPGESLSLGLQLPSAEFGAPGAIGVTADAQGGEGSGTITWTGEGFADGANAADATVAIAAGLGSNTLKLKLDNGFAFADSGTNELLIETVGFDSPLCVDPANGSDETGLGTAVSPLKSLTYALAQLRAGEKVVAAKGLYTTEANGGAEAAFPITVAPGISIVGVRGPEGDETDSTVVDPNRTGGAFILGTMGGDPGTIGEGSLENVAVRNSNGLAVRARYWKGEIGNCRFSALAGIGAENTVGLYCELCKGNVGLTGVEFCCTTTSAQRAIYVASAASESTVTFKDCRFHGLRCTSGSVNSAGFLDFKVPVTFEDCVFEDNSASVGATGESYGFIHMYEVAMTIRRCVFRDMEINYPLICSKRRPVDIDDSLVSGVTGAGSAILQTFRGGANAVNCTFDGVSTLLANTTDYGASTMSLLNCSVSHTGKLNSAPLNTDAAVRNVVLKNTNLYDYDVGTGYTTNMSANVTEYEPGYKNAAKGDYRLSWSSPLVNAGDNDQVVGETDLAGNPRISRAAKGGKVDLGCYENQDAPGLMLIVR